MKKKLILALAAAMLVPASIASADTAAVYGKNCASCHGKDGKGQTRMGKKSGARDYTDAKVQASFTDAEALKAIKEGVKKDGKQKMKGYSSKLSEADMQALVKYVRAFKK